jgi:membrane protein DedA with SNARE-associated domain
MTEFFSGIIAWYMDHINYWTITILMTIESSFIPFPSEIVVPPAAWKAAQGDLNIFLVLFFSSLGAMMGAIINYYLSISLGRKVIYGLARTRLAAMLL